MASPSVLLTFAEGFVPEWFGVCVCGRLRLSDEAAVEPGLVMHDVW